MSKIVDILGMSFTSGMANTADGEALCYGCYFDSSNVIDGETSDEWRERDSQCARLADPTSSVTCSPLSRNPDYNTGERFSKNRIFILYEQ